MKKLITSLTLVMAVVFTFGQMQTAKFQGKEELNTNLSSKIIKNTKNTSSKAASRWYHYGFATETLLQGDYVLKANLLFPDSLPRVIYSGGEVEGPWLHGLAEVLDINSFYWNNVGEDGGELLLNTSSTFTLDSIEMVCIYERKLADPNIVDTLLIEVLVNNPTQYPAYYFAAPVAPNFGTDTLKFVGLKYSQPNNNFGMVGKYTYKLPLTQATLADTNDLGWTILDISTSNLPVSTFKLLSAAYKFIPGYNYSSTDTLASMNYLRFVSFKEVENAYMTSYNKGDYNASYILPQDVRYNNAGSWNDEYLPACAYTATFGYEHHWIYYKLTGVSNYGYVNVQEASKNNINIGYFPNPVTNELTLDLNSNENSTISLFNLVGQNVKNITTNQSSVKMNLSDLTPGVYMLKVSQNNKIFTGKVVVE